ncbi:unnamed protein product [Moneuplotes crassus]|uniref:Uncharacterized protein n=1 Tax=Euplotes crassus TaxID=5936 RepID=A0AAD2D4B1_EUPCR|nr:unnamed protein product [Moneuplotes crassus]
MEKADDSLKLDFKALEEQTLKETKTMEAEELEIEKMKTSGETIDKSKGKEKDKGLSGFADFL